MCVPTYKSDPHGESRPINTEVLQNVVPHETQDGETWSITCMIDLQQNTQTESLTGYNMFSGLIRVDKINDREIFNIPQDKKKSIYFRTLLIT